MNYTKFKNNIITDDDENNKYARTVFFSIEYEHDEINERKLFQRFYDIHNNGSNVSFYSPDMDWIDLDDFIYERNSLDANHDEVIRVIETYNQECDKNSDWLDDLSINEDNIGSTKTSKI